MQLGMVGLGKMGGNMAERLQRAGIQVVGYDRDPALLARVMADGVGGVDALPGLVGRLAAPRAIWIMVPAGPPVDGVIAELLPHLATGDILIDGGNSNYKDTQRRAVELAAQGIQLVDVGTSGGVWGRENGYSLMVGGEPESVERLRPVLAALAPAPDRGWARMGPSGAGHYVKMIHNGIEYGMMQAYAEGFSLMRSKAEFGLDLPAVAEVWRHGSVVRSWLLDLTQRTLLENPTLEGIAPYVPDSGEGRWTVVESIEQSVPIPVIALALMQRFTSRDEYGFGDRLLAAMRNRFGGHAVQPER